MVNRELLVCTDNGLRGSPCIKTFATKEVELAIPFLLQGINELNLFFFPMPAYFSLALNTFKLHTAANNGKLADSIHPNRQSQLG